MCGIFLDIQVGPVTDDEAWRSFMQSSHRGPDSSVFHKRTVTLGGEPVLSSFGFHHLRITDLGERSSQPFWSDDGSYCICNGEIYNHRELRDLHLADHNFGSQSDCEVLLPLFKKFGEKFVDLLDGEFSLIIYSAPDRHIFAARDPVGVRPLYYAVSPTGIQIASELKSISAQGARHFPPSSYCIFSSVRMQPFFQRYHTWESNQAVASTFETAALDLKVRLESAVVKRLSAEVPVGVLLSGGIDSSGVAALAAKHYTGQIETFTCLIEGLPNEDVVHARQVAKLIGSQHHEIIVTLDQIFREIDSIVRVIETHNMEMIPNLALISLVGRYISEKTNVKVLLDGTGPDEMLGGYWFFEAAPDPAAFNTETIKQLRDMHKTELLEERALACYGIEARYPYLDKSVASYIVNMLVDFKLPRSLTPGSTPIEKAVLRHALRDSLPPSILGRKKLGMTHGAGKDFENLFDREVKRRLAVDSVPESALSHGRILGLQNYYRELFDTYFPNGSDVECGVEAASWRSHDPLAVWR